MILKACNQCVYLVCHNLKIDNVIEWIGGIFSEESFRFVGIDLNGGLSWSNLKSS